MCVEDGVGWGGGRAFIRVGPTGLTKSFYDGDSDCSN